ncbi:MAG: hypothetical protein JSU68_15270 [Phycisphaerales bacterium]|nr:MAG: hypothetical protein JSU68_15270 [Phycisphaerales bacterium]
MKPPLRRLGVLVICLLVIIGGVAAFFMIQAQRLRQSGRQYVDVSIPAIMSTWDPDELDHRASPELRLAMPRDEVTAMFAALHERLGPMETYEGCDGEVTLSYTLDEGKAARGTYEAAAKCAKGTLKIQVDLIYVNNNWLIRNLTFTSAALQ